MDSRTTPSKVARFANSGIGPINWVNPWAMGMNGSTIGDGSPPVGLNLELGRGSGHGTKSSGFTIIQLQELQLQALIYKYMEAGLSVPYHLLFPLWKSVVSSLGGLSDEVPPGYPSFLGSSTLSWDYRSRRDSDPEPGRCRRTDGKKWRCSKDVAPLKKYCERHMQRGRQRSRKLVDQPSQHSNTSTGNAPNANTNLSISLSTDSSSNTLSPRWDFCPNTVLHGGGRYPENSAL